MSNIIPPGVGIVSGQLTFQTNTVPPQDAHTDWTGTPGETLNWFACNVVGRALYATVAGGVSGKDYQLLWSLTDSNANIWNRTALLLCAATS
jgi:hypothetical protein